jgi:tetratricopeptide (TPR) repeat protein
MMNRTHRYKLFYGVALLAFALAAGLIGVKAGGGGLMAVAIVCLLPGRIGGYYLKDLFRSRKLADQLRFNEAIDAGDTFLADLRRQPWRRHFIYCFFGFYSWNVEAMARNNIGAARMQLGKIEQAAADLRHAMANDPDYPLPYFNLAIIAHVQGRVIEGDNLLSIAAAKGYSGGPVDRLISGVGAAYAGLQAPT